MRTTISVVMPNYNHAQYLPAAIESFVKQTRPPDEFLILDDASTDNSLEIIESFARDYDCIRVFRNEQNAGVNRANRRLFEAARCDYIHPAAADDERLPNFFADALQLAEQHASSGLVFGKNVFVNDAEEPLETVEASSWTEPIYATPERYLNEYLEVELATHSLSPATIYRRSALKEVGWYREDLGSWADTFAARAIALKYGACYAPSVFSKARRLDAAYSQQTSRNPKKLLDIVARAAQLMRTAEFRDRFPEQHVRRWRRQFKRLVIWNDWLANSASAAEQRPPFLIRNLKRLPRTWRSMQLAFYRPNLDSTTS